MPRRSPRFACPLLRLGYDEIEEGLLPCLTIDEAFALARTCKSLCNFTFLGLITGRQKQMTSVLEQQKHMTSLLSRMQVSRMQKSRMPPHLINATKGDLHTLFGENQIVL